MSTKAVVPATEFKAKCLELMDRVAEGRETYVITKRGRPVARLVPADPPEAESVFGCMSDQTEFVGDLDPLLETDAKWKQLEHERSAQAKAWEREWRRFGTVSGRKPAGPRGARMERATRARPRSRRPKR